MIHAGLRLYDSPCVLHVPLTSPSLFCAQQRSAKRGTQIIKLCLLQLSATSQLPLMFWAQIIFLRTKVRKL